MSFIIGFILGCFFTCIVIFIKTLFSWKIDFPEDLFEDYEFY